MPWESIALRKQPVPIVECPNCGRYPMELTMRGLVQRSKTRWALRWYLGWVPYPVLEPQLYCAIICSRCRAIVGYESPVRSV